MQTSLTKCWISNDRRERMAAPSMIVWLCSGVCKLRVTLRQELIERRHPSRAVKSRPVPPTLLATASNRRRAPPPTDRGTRREPEGSPSFREILIASPLSARASLPLVPAMRNRRRVSSPAGAHSGARATMPPSSSMATTELAPLTPDRSVDAADPRRRDLHPDALPHSTLLPAMAPLVRRSPALRSALQCLVVLLLGAPVLLLLLQLPRSAAPPALDLSLLPCENRTVSPGCAPLHRSLFPLDFVFGSATAAFQVEGAANEGGRQPSIWDTFSSKPGKVLEHPHGRTGLVASDQYHKYAEDIDLMSQLNLDAYRFSISWTRIMKLGGPKPEVNAEGVAYYNTIINGLLKKGIQPYVTLYHWDLPQSLYEAYSGWIDRRVVTDFSVYAETCFGAFGDRVKHWITFNEPKSFTVLGYGYGVHAPGRCSNRESCPDGGNSATEPYLAAHHVLLAHAAAVDIYNRKFRATQLGVVGISVDSEWAEPLTDSVADKDAAELHLQFQLGWFLDPIFRGDYPAAMRKNVGNRLPVFSASEVAMLNGSLDFVGLNHYTTRWISSGTLPQDPLTSDNWQDQGVKSFVERNGTQIGSQAASEWLYIVPWGLGKNLVWISQRYQNPPIFVTENGMDDLDNATMPVAEYLNDGKRVAFYEDYISSVLDAMRNGSDVRGYFAWSLLDNFEWQSGYTRRFGLVYVDYQNQQRHLKDSAKWFSEFLTRPVS